MTVVRSGSASHVGRVRAVNEDLALDALTLYAVADGMGGHAGGEVAARVAIDALQSAFGKNPTPEGLLRSIEEANARVFERSRSDPEVRGMGTTIVAAAIVSTADGDRLVLANVGDSRAYRYRAGRLDQLSSDHSVAEELVARGELTEAEAAVHPHRHILTRALGVGPDVEIDAWMIVPCQGDRFLLCSDGLTNEVGPEEIAAVLSATPDPADAAQRLVQAANDNGGNDNVTAVVIDVLVGEDPRTCFVDAVPITPSASAITPPSSALPPDGRASKPGVASQLGPTDQEGVAGGVLVAERAGSSWPEDLSSSPPSLEASRSPSLAGEEPQIEGEPEPGDEPPVPPVGSRELAKQAKRAAKEQKRALRPNRRLRPKGQRVLTFRLVLFLLLVGGVVYGAWWTTKWYVDNSWFVRVPPGSDDLVIYQGRPEGFLWFHPKEVQDTHVTLSQVPGSYVPILAAGVEQPSRQAALSYVSRLEQELIGQQQASAPATSPTGSTSSGSTTTPGDPATPSPSWRWFGSSKMALAQAPTTGSR